MQKRKYLTLLLVLSLGDANELLAGSSHICSILIDVCACFLPIYSGRQVRWMYQPGSHRRKVTQDFSSTFLLRRMPLFLSREGFSRSFPSSTVKSNFVYSNDLIALHLLGIFIFYFLFFIFSEEKKNTFTGYELTSQRVRGLRGDQLSCRGDQ